MNTSSNIHLALASDENYFEGLLTTAWSTARNCSRPEQLVIEAYTRPFILPADFNRKLLP